MSNVIKIETLNKSNYDTWKIQMRALLIKNDAWCYVSGDLKKPTIEEEREESVKAREAWSINDEKAKSDIILSISPSELKQIKDCKTSRDVWIKLEQIYQSKGPARKATLLKQLTLQRMSENDDVREHLRIFFDSVDKLKDMDIEINSDLLAIMMLYSLPQSFANFRCAIESRDELPAPEALRVKIIEESDVRRNESRDAIPNAMIAGKYRKTIYKKNFDKSETKFRDSTSHDNTKIKCFRCRRIGHKASECNRDGRQSARNIEGVSVLAISDVGPRNEALRADIVNRNIRWCLDSGCTAHLCKDLKFFTIVDESKSGRLNLANSASTDINARGKVHITTKCDGKSRDIELNDTLHVPDLRTNLLSVGKITDRGYDVIFSKHRAQVLDKNGNCKMIADRKDGLYYIRQEDSDNHNVMMIKKQDKNKQAPNMFELWHNRLGHLNAGDLLVAKQSGIIPNGEIKDFKQNLNCEICIRGKMTKSPFPKRSARATGMLDIVYSDVCGPMRVNSNANNKYFVTFTDDYSRWCEVRFIKSKDQVFDAFVEYKKYIENQTGCKIKAFQSDNGREYVNLKFDKFLADHGIKRRLTVAYNPQQNGIAERKNRTLLDTARCLLVQSGLSSSFWAEAVMTGNYVRNRCPSKSLEGKTAFEILYGKLPNIKYFKVFGCDAYCLNSDPNKGKFASRANKGIFVGYAENSKGYRIWFQEKRRVDIVRDVKFIENYCNNRNGSFSEFESVQFPLNDTIVYDDESDNKSDDKSETNKQEKRDIEILLDSQIKDRRDIVSNELDDEVNNPDSNDRIHESQKFKKGRGRPSKILTGMRGRPRKKYCGVQIESEGSETIKNDEPRMNEINELEMSENVNAFVVEIPIEQAIISPESNEWLESIAVELKSIIKNETWKLVDRPTDKSVIGSRVVLCNKYKPDGEIERRKARIVARGFSQRPGVDFNETYAPVARIESIRIASALSALYNMDIHQLDVTSAYLNGKLDEQIFMEVPNNIEDALDILIKTEPKNSKIKSEAVLMRDELHRGNKVCLMKKALYGLKQAGRSWHRRLDSELKRFGLRSSNADSCVYLQGKGNDRLIVLVYVDDLLVLSSNAKRIRSFKDFLSNVFEIRDIGKVKSCLGIEFQTFKNEIRLGQRGYIKDILNRFGMSDCKVISTPMETNLKLRNETNIENDGEIKLPYRELIGCLNYIAVSTRPDIAHAVNVLSQFCNCYGKTHWTAAKRILRYLKGTSDVGLSYKQNDNSVVGYVDADWGNCPNDRRSYTGYSFILAGAAVSWDSRKQRTVALSSVEAEYMSLSDATKQAIYLRRFLVELGFEKLSNIRLSCDNQGALRLAENPIYHSRTKHIDVRHHFVRTALRNKEIELQYIPTDEMMADLFTKGLPFVKHKKFSDVLGLGIIKND